MKDFIDDYVYILITYDGCVAICGGENFKKHMLEVTPCFENELKEIFESDEKTLDDLNSLMAKMQAHIVCCPRDIYENGWRKPYEIGFNQILKENR